MTELPLVLFGMLTGSLLFAMAMGGGQTGRHLPEYLEALRVAPHLDDSAVGFAAKKSDTFKAFEEAYKAGSAIRADLDWLVEHGSPAGRIYAAILIGKLDKAAGEKALESLKSNHDSVEYRSGDLYETRTVADLAEALLKGEAIIIFPPSMQ